MSTLWRLLHQVREYVSTSCQRTVHYILLIAPVPAGTAHRPVPLPRWYGSFQSSITPSFFALT